MSLVGTVGSFLLVTATASASAPKPAPIIPLTLVHPTSYDVRLHVDPDGSAVIEHALGVRVSGGPLRVIELRGVDRSSTLVDAVQLKSEDGKIYPGALVIKDDGTVRVESLEEKGLKRGAYTVHFSLKTDLLKTDALKREGAFYRLAWKSPTLGDGVDGMRVVFDLPAAPTEPRSVAGTEETGASSAGATSTLATLRRGPGRDELEIVRPHVGRGEAALWEARVDPRALPAIASPALAPHPLVAPAASTTPIDTPWVPAAVAGLVFAAIAWWKLKGPRAVVAGAAIGFAGYAVLLEAPIWAAMASVVGCLALVQPLMVLRTRRMESSASLRARGPGEWLALRPSDAFAFADLPWMSLSTRRGRALLVVLLALVAVGGWLVSDLDERAPVAAIVAGLALTTLFAQSRRNPAMTEHARGPLASAYGKLAADDSLRVVPWARIPRGRDLPEEVRLRVLPRLPMPGLVSLELGTGGEDLEVLVRVRDDSPAARRIGAPSAAALFPAPRAVPGRTAAERVLSIEPPSPSVAAACALARDLGELFVDRRAGEPDPSFGGLERRGV